MQKLWVKETKIKWFSKSSRAAIKLNRSDSHFTGRNFLKNIKSYWLEPDKDSLDLCKNNIYIVTCNDGYTIQAFKHSGGEKATEIPYETDGSVKLTTGGCILFTAIYLILECMCFLTFRHVIFPFFAGIPVFLKKTFKILIVEVCVKMI